jgi:hypothetical protein
MTVPPAELFSLYYKKQAGEEFCWQSFAINETLGRDLGLHRDLLTREPELTTI